MTDSNVYSNRNCAQTSSSLLEKIRAHDQPAWQRLVHLYGPLVHHWCLQAGLKQADAEDIAQETFRAVHKSIADFQHEREKGTFRGWLRTITNNKVRDFRRRDRPDHHGIGGSEGEARLAVIAQDEPSGSECVVFDERLLVLRRAVELILDECKEPTRQAFWKTVIEGRPVADVAQELGISRDAIYCARSRILCRLKTEFAQLLEIEVLRPPPRDGQGTAVESSP